MSDSAAQAAAGKEKPGYGAKLPPTDPLQDAIDEIRKKADDAKEAKVKADGESTALDGQLAALLSLKKDSDKAKLAYEAAHEQLTIDQQAFQDYDESAKEELGKQLKDKGIRSVNDLIAAKNKADKDRADAVDTAKKNLQDAKDVAADAEKDRKAEADDLNQYKQLATTIGAKHAKLKALRDEATKARQASQPGLAYWLLTHDNGFEAQLTDVDGWLIKPSELPDRLLDAINKLAAAEAAKAAADGTVAKRQAELAEAERQNADQKANGEKDLRDKLSKIPRSHDSPRRHEAREARGVTPMPEYLSPGVYIEEIERGPKPIEGVATSTAAFLGETQRGPQTPTLVTSYSEYLRTFGDIFGPDKYMPYALKTFFDNGGRRCYVTRVVGDGAATSTVEIAGLRVTAIGPGNDYNKVWIRVGPGSTKDKDGNAVGFRLRVYYWADAQDVPGDEGAIDTGKPATTLEIFDDLSVNRASVSYFEQRVNNRNSALIEVLPADPDAGVALPTTDTAAQMPAVSDGNPVNAASYEVDDADPGRRKGLAALDLDAFRSVAVVYAPGAPYDAAQKVVTHCERNRFRFAVVDAQSGLANATSIDSRRDVDDTQYGAFYYPWIWISDPRSGARKLVPPGGAVCGIYALTDNTRGVFKAPANETIAGAIDLEYDVNQRVQDTLNPAGVNVIRRFPGRGIRVWGARTMSSDPLWKYVNVRRLFIFLEASIYNSTQWVVFEPNDQRLWARVKQTVTLFLRTQWREGALFGAKEEEAFSVAVGRETMTEDDILNGRLIIEVGVAPVRPAEFVVFRIFQKTQEAKS